MEVDTMFSSWSYNIRSWWARAYRQSRGQPRRSGPSPWRVKPRLETMEDRTLLSPGGMDLGFGSAGKTTVAFDIGGGFDDEAHAVALQPDGKIVLAGSAQVTNTNYDFAVVRLTANGQ